MWMFVEMRGAFTAVYDLAGGCQEIGKTSCIRGCSKYIFTSTSKDVVI